MKRFLSFLAFIINFVVGLAVIIGLFYLLRGTGKETGNKQAARKGPMGPSAVAVEIAPLRTGSLVDEGRFVGTIEPASSFVVSPKISGRIKKLFVDIGDSVSNGSAIARLDDEELLLAVKQTEADLEIARANCNESAALLEISQKDIERVQKMRQQKVSSEVDVENAQASHKTRQSKHQVNKALLIQKEAALEAARLRLSYATVDVSWTEGANQRYIAERFLNEGAMVSANTAIVSVIDIATVTAVIDVVEKDYFKIRTGMSAQIEPAAMPGRVFNAKVSRISPRLDVSSRQARIELEMANPDYALKPGMFINARIIYDTHNSVTIAPASSIVRRNNEEGLFLADHEKNIARFVAVKSGFVENDAIEIVSPAISGDVVILGHHLLEDGAGIIISNTDKTGTNGRINGKTNGKGGNKQ
jgi:RND family efflux transporter MFP subunit